MCYRSLLFPPETPLFPPASTVQTYLEDYASQFNLYQHIRLSTAVTLVDWDTETSTWRVELDNGEVGSYELLIVANGHYALPRWPDTPGLDAWRAEGKAIHSAWYRRPDPFGQTVLVVGAGPSGQDVKTDMRLTGRTIVHSMTGAVREDREGGAYRVRGRIAEYLDPVEGRVRFEDGTEESGIDSCVLATGYQYDFAFFAESVMQRAMQRIPPLPEVLHNSTWYLFPLARHLWPLVDKIPPHALAFLGLPMRVAPLPLIEAQAHATVALFSNPRLLDTPKESNDVLKKYEGLKAKLGGDDRAVAAAWRKFGDQEQFDYRDALHALAGGKFAGDEWKVPEWTKLLYAYKLEMRAEWVELERIGEAGEWVKGVGRHGDESEQWAEWVELMWKVVRRAEKRGDDDASQKVRSDLGELV